MSDSEQDFERPKWITWAIYTLIFGMIPILLRGTVTVYVRGVVPEALVPGDLASFSLLLVVTNFNAVESVDPTIASQAKFKAWKPVFVGVSGLLTALVAGILVLAYSTEAYKQEGSQFWMLVFTGMLTIGTVIYSIYIRKQLIPPTIPTSNSGTSPPMDSPSSPPQSPPPQPPFESSPPAIGSAAQQVSS